jgi:hypothetical protein
MSQFVANNGSFTPAANATQLNNWVLSALTVGYMAKIKMINWGGRGTTSTAYRTRWARVSNTAATPTALTIQPTTPLSVPLCSVNTYATQATGAADPAGLFAQDWNVLGGGGVIVLPIGGEWFVVGGALGTLFNQIGCGNIAGADASQSSYGLQWEE